MAAKYQSVEHAARALGLSAPWLKAEVARGRLPAIRVRRRYVVNVEQLDAILRERAARNVAGRVAR